MKYVIRITRIEEKTITRRGEHTVIDEIPWTEEALRAESVYGPVSDFIKRNPLKKVYGYAPSYQGVEKTETEVLSQTVDSLDLPAVIKAINGL